MSLESFLNSFTQYFSPLISKYALRKNPLSKTKTNTVFDNNPFSFLINDIQTTDLTTNINPKPLPLNNLPPFTIDGYTGGNCIPASTAGRAAGCYAVISNLTDKFNSLSEIPLMQWASRGNLQIVPEAGNDLNAYYSRRAMKFFSYEDNKFGQFFTSSSSDIIAHELGHAILDAHRPELFDIINLEVASIHEAFADFASMMHVLLYPEGIQYLLRETNGNLHQSNIVTRLSEYMGNLVYKISGDSSRNPYALRDAVNDFKYISPESLLEIASDNELSANPHSFGRIYSATLYSIFVMMYEHYCKDQDPITAVSNARDTLIRYVIKAVNYVPASPLFFSAFSKTMLWADVVYSNRLFHDRMQQIFFDRNILAPEIKILSNNRSAPNSSIHLFQPLQVKLSDVFLQSQGVNSNPLFEVNLSLANSEATFYDDEGYIYDHITSDLQVMLDSAKDMVNYLNDNSLVGEGQNQPFLVLDGQLIRKYIS